MKTKNGVSRWQKLQTVAETINTLSIDLQLVSRRYQLLTLMMSPQNSMSRDMISRRALFRTLAVGSTTFVAGCPDFPPSRTIDITMVEWRESQGNVSLNVSVRTRDNTGRGFENVTVLGTTANGDVVCSESVGNMSNDGNQEEITVSLDCSTMPAVLLPRSDASPCDDNTNIEIRRFNTSSQVWETDELECSE